MKIIRETPRPPKVRVISVDGNKVTNRCVGAIVKRGRPTTIKVGSKLFKLHGYELTDISKKADGKVKLGLLSDAKDATRETIANIKKFLGHFKKAGVEAIILTGDIAEEAKDIQLVVETLAQSGVPVFVVMGNREGIANYQKGVMAAAAKFSNVFDMNTIRFFDGDDFDLISLPGYHNANHVRAKDGCAYTTRDVLNLHKLRAKANSPLILVTHGPPQGTGKTALDYSDQGANVGDPKLVKIIRAARIPFGVFGNVHEAGGRTVGGDFLTPLPKNQWQTKLYANIGPASAFPWKLHGGMVTRGMAGIFELRGSEARFRSIKLK